MDKNVVAPSWVLGGKNNSPQIFVSLFARCFCSCSHTLSLRLLFFCSLLYHMLFFCVCSLNHTFSLCLQSYSCLIVQHLYLCIYTHTNKYNDYFRLLADSQTTLNWLSVGSWHATLSRLSALSRPRVVGSTWVERPHTYITTKSLYIWPHQCQIFKPQQQPGRHNHLPSNHYCHHHGSHHFIQKLHQHHQVKYLTCNSLPSN